MEIKNLKDITYLFNDKEYLLLGHGTGRRGESSEVIESIFSTGLRTKDNSLYYTTMGLETSNIDDLINRLNNWPHLNSKKIILIRVPIEYININGESSDLHGEKFGAFTYPKADDDGKITYYLDPKFIIGCYDASTGIVTLNDKFEKELSLKSIETLKKRYLECVQKTKRRNERLSNAFSFLFTSSSSYDIDLPNFDFDETKKL